MRMGITLQLMLLPCCLQQDAMTGKPCLVLNTLVEGTTDEEGGGLLGVGVIVRGV
jgi:hypothetical protein